MTDQQYPPPGPGYPPQGTAYPPAQGGYPPPTGVYPPPQAGYPPPDATGYPPKEGYSPAPPQGYLPGNQPPPPQGYSPQPPQPQQQTTSNVVVVTGQPQVTSTVVHVSSSVPDYTILSIVMTILCIFFNCFALVCTIPAIFLAVQAKEEAARGEQDIALQHARIALYLNIGAIVSWVVIWIIWIAIAAAT
ncbi:cell death-inducing p53-target protein 1 homolog isoform X2 [Dysidea avara]|uniref:cell death-inducing p53-target protein 1 homolog isoform X2 n=1 Tax=Dysidea avara TaxID=196820 RepID=UPI00333282CD